MAKTKKIKSKAQINVPQTRDAAAADIRKIGDLQREIQVGTAKMNDLIAEITEEYQHKLSPLLAELEALQKGVESYCAANRDALTDGGRVKTANLITGDVNWRIRPPSVSVTGEESVIATLISLGLKKFIRIKAAVNKEAILNEPDAVKGIAGIKINSGIEDFVIEPFEQEVKA